MSDTILHLKKISFYKKYIHDLNLNKLSQNYSLPLEIVYQFPNLNWNWQNLSKNKFITIKFIIDYKNKPLNWSFLTLHTNILVEDILETLDLHWNIDLISLNKNITNNIILNNLDFPWVLHYLIQNENLNIAIKKLLIHRDLQQSDLLEYCNIYMNLDIQLHNTNIDYDKNIRKLLNLNEFNLIFDLDITENKHILYEYQFTMEKILIEKIYYVNKIKKWWYEIIHNPYHKVGKKFLDNKFNRMMKSLELSF